MAYDNGKSMVVDEIEADVAIPNGTESLSGLGTHGVLILYRDFCKYEYVFFVYLLPESFQSTSIAST